jgi:hypothetical protein
VRLKLNYRLYNLLVDIYVHMEPTTTPVGVKFNKWQITLLILILTGLIVGVIWLTLNIVNQPRIVQNNGSTTTTGVVDTRSSTSTTITNNTSNNLQFQQEVSVPVPNTDQVRKLTYTGVMPRNTVIEMLKDSEDSQLGDLQFTHPNFVLSLSLEWDDITSDLEDAVSYVNINNPSFANLARGKNVDAETTDQYTYFQIVTQGCASKKCINGVLSNGNTVKIVAKCQIQEVVGVNGCDEIMSTLKFTFE